MILEIFVGFFVGIMVAMTGIGGGALLMPILLLMGLPTLTAVGTDIVFNFVTKAWSVFLHFTKKLEWKIVVPLAIGIVISGVFSNLVFKKINNSLVFFVIITIMVVASLFNLYRYLKKGERKTIIKIDHWVFFVLAGLVVSFLVNLTSIGVGVLMTLILLYFTDIKEKNIVKIDLIFGFIATFFGSLLHLRFGHVDFRLVGLLIIGSLPGSYVGYHLHNRIDYRRFRIVLSLIILSVALFLLVREFAV